MARKLKVFQARFGFHDSVVAASSRPAALRAWGTHQNLFADGLAREAADAAAIAAALAQPEIPLRRPLGSAGPFTVAPTELPRVPDLPARRAERAKASSRPRPPADRSRLDAAERALAALDERRKRDEEAFERRRRDLEDEETTARSAYLEGRKAAKARVAHALKAYRTAGGTG